MSVQPLPPKLLKGKSAPVPLFRVVGMNVSS
jgi:hypothetical protein